MKKQGVISFFTSLVLILSLASTGVVAAQSSATTGQDPISQGLWAGANFDFSFLSSDSGASQQSGNTASNSRIYAALGDSVAAGQGLPPSDRDTRCDRSSDAYPNKIAKQRNLHLLHIACSGATAGDLITHQGVSGPNIEPQLDSAFANGTPELITITAGANDIEWFNFLRKCYSLTCGTNTDNTVAASLRGLMQGKLYAALLDIQWRSGGQPPQVVVTGYYNPLSSRCSTTQPRLTSSELAWINKQVNSLNQALKTVSSQFGFVKFAPVSFTGHDVCSNDPWVQGINDVAPLHPTAKGQDAIARAVLEVL